MGLILGAWTQADACTAEVVANLLAIDSEEDEFLALATSESAVVAEVVEIINDDDYRTDGEERDEHDEYP